MSAQREPPVSVVIPSRDGRRTLLRALDSVVLSAPLIKEVIVVQSNSPPEFIEFCNQNLTRYAEHFKLIVLESETPSNGSIARNGGIRAATGKYMAFLDDDDEWMDGKIHAYLQFIEKQQLHGDFVVFSPVISCNEARERVVIVPAIKYCQQPIADFILSPLGGAQTSALMLPTALAKRVGFDPKLIRHQDYDFCIRLEECGARFWEIEKPMSYWYQHGTLVDKGSNFEYCANWVKCNRGRFSRAAFLSYVEKDLLRSARQSSRLRDYWRFVGANFTPLECIASIVRLGNRALISLLANRKSVKIMID